MRDWKGVGLGTSGCAAGVTNVSDIVIKKTDETHDSVLLIYGKLSELQSLDGI